MKGDVKQKYFSAGWRVLFFLASSPPLIDSTDLRARVWPEFFMGERARRRRFGAGGVASFTFAFCALPFDLPFLPTRSVELPGSFAPIKSVGPQDDSEGRRVRDNGVSIIPTRHPVILRPHFGRRTPAVPPHREPSELRRSLAPKKSLGPQDDSEGRRAGWRRPPPFGVCDLPKGLLRA